MVFVGKSCPDSTIWCININYAREVLLSPRHQTENSLIFPKALKRGVTLFSPLLPDYFTQTVLIYDWCLAFEI
jgi:hypothetical protein